MMVPYTAATLSSNSVNGKLIESVTLTTSKPATIYYTTDGSTPTTNSEIYTTPLTISPGSLISFFSTDEAGNKERIRYLTSPGFAIVPAGSVNISADKHSPALIGSNISFSANATGGSGYYEYYFTLYNPNTKKWIVAQPYGVKNDWLWNTSTYQPGTYSLQVWARSAGSKASYEAIASLSYTINTRVTSVSVSKDKNSPQVQGSVISFSAIAAGSSGLYEYSFRLFNPHIGEWTEVQDYSANNQWVWDTASYSSGDYTIEVWARNKGSSLSYESVNSLTYIIEPPPPLPVSGVSLTSDMRSPQVQNSVISFSASAVGGSGEYDYYFTLFNPHIGKWIAVQAYGANNRWVWDTSGYIAGTYTLQVWARNKGSNRSYESFKSLAYVIEAPAPLPTTGVSLTYDKKSPQIQDSVISFLASASGGSGEYEYYFTLLNPHTGKWTIAQAYGANNNWVWDTNGYIPGAYTLQVWARSKGSRRSYESFESLTFIIEPVAPPPVTKVLLTYENTTPQIQGSVISFSASASGGSGEYEYYFTLYNPNDKVWTSGQAYGPNYVWTWNTKGYQTGKYIIEVWARSLGSKASLEAHARTTLMIEVPPPQG